MPRLNYIKPEDAKGETKEIFDNLKDEYGKVFNQFKGMAINPVALKAYTMLEKVIADGDLSEKETEIAKLAVSHNNRCKYCTSAHFHSAKQKGADEEILYDLIRGESDDKKLSTLWWFTRHVMNTKGYVDDNDIQKFRDAGYDDTHIPEIVTIIGQKTLSNYFNHIHDTEVDMPEIPEVEMQENR